MDFSEICCGYDRIESIDHRSGALSRSQKKVSGMSLAYDRKFSTEGNSLLLKYVVDMIV